MSLLALWIKMRIFTVKLRYRYIMFIMYLTKLISQDMSKNTLRDPQLRVYYLMSLSPFCVAFPFGTEAGMTENGKASVQ